MILRVYKIYLGGNQMNTIRKHEALFFYIFTYFLTGLLFFIPALIFPNNMFPFHLLAPAIISFFIVGLLDKTDGIKNFVKGFFPARIHFKWVIISMLLPVIIVFTSAIAEGIVGGQSFNFFSDGLSITPGFIFLIAIGCIGEEIGWRSYLLPLLLKKHSNLWSSIILGTLWGFWHAGDYGEGVGFLLFVVSTVAMSIMMTWLYQKSGGSLIVAVLYHFCSNVAGSYVAFIHENGTPSISSRVIMAIVCIIPTIILVFISPVFREKKRTDQSFL